MGINGNHTYKFSPALANFPVSANQTHHSPEVHHTQPIRFPGLATAVEA
jgi:hypothetical protein